MNNTKNILLQKAGILVAVFILYTIVTNSIASRGDTTGGWTMLFNSPVGWLLFIYQLLIFLVKFFKTGTSYQAEKPGSNKNSKWQQGLRGGDLRVLIYFVFYI